MITLKDLIEFASKNCEQIFKVTGEIVAMFHMCDADENNFIWQPDMADKDAMAAAARQIMCEKHIQSYVFIDEAWILEIKRTLKPGEAEEIERFCNEFGVSNHPDRREVLMFYAESKSGERLQAHRPIVRPEHGKPKLMSLRYPWQGGTSRGRLVGLLQP
jgi:hypothetical protein